ncbi:flavin reductase family protein [Halobacillus sp. K22]|uniref:flavin reductase family protein n=1 Tax=Halobacillus sp. K22 TaxID=3457431 RepID=UPI003FCC6238
MKKQDHVKMHSYPGMVAVVGVLTESGANFMAAGWHAYLSISPPMYGVAIGRERYTYSKLKAAKRLSINFLPYQETEFIQYSGTVSGEDVNKLSSFNQDWYISEAGYPLLKDSYLAYECLINQFIPTGDHEWIITRISGCHYKEEFFLEDGLPDLEKLEFPLYLGRSTYLKLDNQVEKQVINPKVLNKKVDRF